ncbi:hypothetical protein [uncultured Psychroserpens sp.]|uniref:hypothetical protein n=1 Tax=uncultured Psychroserpens sp. TaxID=255436 RepID=UPI002612B5AF|nr:hypothetical protein [uncultured Psychroserpens sp.]
MRQLLYICLIGLLALSCDDGDVFEINLEFDQTLELCLDANEGDYLLYDTKVDPNESLSLLFPIASNGDIFNPPSDNYEKIIPINGTSTMFNYRTYSGDPNDLICQIIPNPGTTITNDYAAGSGAEAKFVTSFDDDDNDGILSEFEGRGAQAADGTYPDAIDTDGDGIPDYIDQDDDNDNILTINENADPDGDGNPSDAVNTDLDFTNGDMIPNYLDNDDDGDGVPTINEDENSNSSLTDDFDEIGTNPNTARYLNPDAAESFTAGDMLENEYTRTIVVTVDIMNANISIASIDDQILGTYTFTITLPEDN